MAARRMACFMALVQVGIFDNQHLSMVKIVCVAGLNLNRASMIALQPFDHFWMALDVALCIGRILGDKGVDPVTQATHCDIPRDRQCVNTKAGRNRESQIERCCSTAAQS